MTAPKPLTIIPPDANTIPTKYGAIVARADAMVVNTHDDYVVALEAVRQLDDGKRFIVDLCKKPKSDAHQAHKSVTTLEKTLLDPIATARSTINRKAIGWKQKADAARRAEEQRIRDAEAARQREIERREREDRERKERAEQDERDRIQREEEALAAAAQAENDGDLDGAAELIESVLVDDPVQPPVEPAPEPAPLPEVPAPVVREVPTIAGAGTRKVWKSDVIDLVKVVQFVAANPEHIGGLSVNQAYWNAIARAEHDRMDVPGIIPVCVESLTTRKS